MSFISFRAYFSTVILQVPLITACLVESNPPLLLPPKQPSSLLSYTSIKTASSAIVPRLLCDLHLPTELTTGSSLPMLEMRVCVCVFGGNDC